MVSAKLEENTYYRYENAQLTQTSGSSVLVFSQIVDTFLHLGLFNKYDLNSILKKEKSVWAEVLANSNPCEYLFSQGRDGIFGFHIVLDMPYIKIIPYQLIERGQGALSIHCAVGSTCLTCWTI